MTCIHYPFIVSGAWQFAGVTVSQQS